jgi:signal transduction histidine kinase
MRNYPIPFNEEARLHALRDAPGLTRADDPLLDAICDAARRLLRCPIAHVSVVEEDSQWYKSVVGITLDEMPKQQSFCTHTIMSDAPLVVPDLSKDPRFADHPMVVAGGPQARFYAGVPLVLSSGYRFGSLCALDLAPHEMPSEHEMDLLRDLGRAVVAAVERKPLPEAPRADLDPGPETFITLIGHELRTPLTVMLGALKMLEARVLDQVDRKLVSTSRRSTEHLAKLIESILDFSNATTGELLLNETATDLGALLAEVAEMEIVGLDGSPHGLALGDIRLGRPVLVDAEQIKLALTALMLNAVLHGGNSKWLTAGVDDAGNIEIRIADDGTLGGHVDLDELFKPFVVGGNLARRGTRGGLGLGLPLTRKLVELHGGEFEIETRPGATSAVIRLPRWRIDAARLS